MLTEEDRDALESSAVAGDAVINAAFAVAVHSQDLDYLATLFTDIATVRRGSPQVSCSASAIDRYAGVVVVVIVAARLIAGAVVTNSVGVVVVRMLLSVLLVVRVLFWLGFWLWFGCCCLSS